MGGKKVWKKTGFGILFVAACFIAMYILMEFHGDVLMVAIAAVLLLIAAFLFLNAVFSDKAKNWAPQENDEEETKEVISGNGDGEFRLKITKHMKEMENSQKELIDVLKNQNTLIQTQIENLEHEIYMLSEKQVNQAKSIIKFNKENARQMAISERETLEYVMMELKKTIEDNYSRPVPERNVPVVKSVNEEELPMAQPLAEEPAESSVLEEVLEEDLFAVSDLPGDDEFVMPELPVMEEAPVMVEETPVEETLAEDIEIPEMPEDIDLSELFDIPELMDVPEEETTEEDIPATEVLEEPLPVVEEKQEEPAPNPLAGLTADPNAMMSPEDIAKLLEAMGQ